MISDDEVRAKMLAMAENLLSASKEGKISWRLTDVEDKYIYAGTRSSVTIESVSDRFEGDTTVLCLLNGKGTIVDSLETGSVPGDGDTWVPNPWNRLLDDLYHAARRVANNVDEALDSMISDIQRGTPSPTPKPKPKPKPLPDADPWATDGPGGYSDEPPF